MFILRGHYAANGQTVIGMYYLSFSTGHQSSLTIIMHKLTNGETSAALLALGMKTMLSGIA